MRYWILLFTVFVKPVFACPVEGGAITALTESYRPYQYSEDGELHGPVADLVREVGRVSGCEIRFQVLPWARAYQRALNEPDRLIFSIVRTEERESRFHWLGVVAPYHVYFWRNRERADIELKAVTDARRYLLGAVRDDVNTEYLIGKGFVLGEDMITVHRNTLNIKKLINGRIELFIEDELNTIADMKSLGYTMDQIEPALFVEDLSSDLYLAFSRHSNPELIAVMRKAMADIRADGRYDRLVLEPLSLK